MHNQSITPTYEAEQHIIAATQHIIKALGASKILNDDLRSVLKELDSRLSSMAVITESIGSEFAQIEEQLKCAERKIMRWKSNLSSIWDSGQQEAAEYLQAITEILQVIESLRGETLSENRKAIEITFHAQHLLQLAMSRLEYELCHILVQHKQYFRPQYVSFRSPAEDVVYDESFTSIEDEMVEETSRKHSNDGESFECTLDLVSSHVIPDLKSIANVMSACNHIQEFSEAFIGVRREALQEYFSSLEMEKFSIEDVMKLEWGRLNSEIKKWIWAMKIIVRGYLASEKRLCDQILGDFSAANSYCFVEISKDTIFCLLNFGQAVAMGPCGPEKLFCLLDMHEVLADVHLEIDVLFSEDNGSFLRIEFHELLSRLGDSAKETFVKFRTAILSDASINPFPGGGIHHITRYVTNYIRLFPAYRDTLNVLLKGEDEYESNALEKVDEQGIPNCTFCPMACQLRAITSALESNLIEKSKLYKDESLQHVFIINNIHYIVEKVKKDSELKLLFGDAWIREHYAKCQQRATSYVRAAWSSAVSLIRDDKRTVDKERCRKFCDAFEEVYKNQTRWHIPDNDLRADMQISISQQVIPPYRQFLGRLNNNSVNEKHVKYKADDLERMILDLFVGSPRSLRNSRRR